MDITINENDKSMVKVTDDQMISLHVGPELNCEQVDSINTKNKFTCLNCNTKNPVILTISNTFSFVFGAFLENICCCVSSVSQRAIMTAVLTIVLVGGTTGGIVGIYIKM